ncbi:MAG: DUF1893 domain-containing protein [Acutalibacteraceae bacterium]
MRRDLESCKEILQSEDFTCVILQNGNFLKTKERGIRPFIKLIEDDENLKDCAAADKVVGRAAALLMQKVGLRSVYAAVLSEPAEEILKNAGIYYEYERLVPRIQNRKGDGLCPMESAVIDINDADEAYTILRSKIKNSSSKQKI